jgi:hypothetical protein
MSGMRTLHAPTLALLAVIPLAGCASAAAPAAPSLNGSAMLVDTLYFGTAKAEGRVSPEEWQAFVDTFVTPRFPTGLTWWKASGQWTGKSGLQREETFVLQLAHGVEPQADQAITEIMNEYKTRFQQEAVLRLRTTAGAKF